MERTVLVTGAAGRIGTYLRGGLPDLGWRLRLLDRVPIAGEPEAVVADIRDPVALGSAMAEVSAVVHLAGVVRPADPFEEVMAVNIEGTYQVMEAARRAGVERFVFASSNHANGYAPRSEAQSAQSEGQSDRPDSYYGVSKIFGEALGRLYADRHGMRVACIRIGSCFDRPRVPRMLGSWLSPGDVVRLVDACLRSPDLEYALCYGISRNTRRWWDLAPAEALGYRPEDDAEEYAAEVLAPFGGVDPEGPDAPQGGEAARAEAGGVRR